MSPILRAQCPSRPHHLLFRKLRHIPRLNDQAALEEAYKSYTNLVANPGSVNVVQGRNYLWAHLVRQQAFTYNPTSAIAG
jgi:hypothetical protein